MKRNENLVELSRDHHHGLLLGWKIKQGLKFEVPVSEMAEYIVHFAKEALIDHFKEEENEVLIFLDSEDDFRKRTLKEHQELLDLVQEISSTHQTNPDLILKLVTLLDAHIRFEERELFPYMEQKLSLVQLEEIGKGIASSHQPYVESYHNEFWIK